MTELQSALSNLTGWLEEGENLDRFAAYLAAQAGSAEKPNLAKGTRQANEIFELLRDATGWPSAIDDTADWDAD